MYENESGLLWAESFQLIQKGEEKKERNYKINPLKEMAKIVADASFPSS